MDFENGSYIREDDGAVMVEELPGQYKAKPEHRVGVDGCVDEKTVVNAVEENGRRMRFERGYLCKPMKCNRMPSGLGRYAVSYWCPGRELVTVIGDGVSLRKERAKNGSWR